MAFSQSFTKKHLLHPNHKPPTRSIGDTEAAAALDDRERTIRESATFNSSRDTGRSGLKGLEND